jgi:hypothetical protein
MTRVTPCSISSVRCSTWRTLHVPTWVDMVCIVAFVYWASVAEAWHIARTLDPLLDSDDDENVDYNVRIDTSECLRASRYECTKVCF